MYYQSVWLQTPTMTWATPRYWNYYTQTVGTQTQKQGQVDVDRQSVPVPAQDENPYMYIITPKLSLGCRRVDNMLAGASWSSSGSPHLAHDSILFM